VFFSGHAHYGIGGGFAPNAGFRQSLDASAGVAFGTERGRTWIISPSLITGFGADPTYTVLDLGSLVGRHMVDHAGVMGTVISAGPALRLAPSISAGWAVGIRGFFNVLQVGARAI
jgi:hypothetical protein